MNILKQFDTVSASEEGAWLHLVTPGADEKSYLDEERTKPLRIKLKGPDSDAWTSFQRKAIKSNNQKDDKTAHEIALEDAKLFAKMTIDWENIPDDNGEPLEFSKDAAIKLYLTYKDIRMQALRFVIAQENFTRKPSHD